MECKHVYKSNPRKQCPRKAVSRSDRCIFHLEEESKDFRGQDLREEDLEEAFLVKANLSGAKLDGAILISAKLKDANLKKASLINADLSHAHLEGAHLEETKAIDADFSYAHLEGAHLEWATIINTDFLGADLKKAYLNYTTLTGSDFSNADLEDANFSGAYLDGCIFYHANIKGTDFRNAGVRYARSWEYARKKKKEEQEKKVLTIKNETVKNEEAGKEEEYETEWKKVLTVKNEEAGKNHKDNKKWDKAFAEFCYASKIYNDLSYYFKERGMGEREDEFLRRKWEMRELAAWSLFKLDLNKLGDKENKEEIFILLNEIFGLSEKSVHNRIRLKVEMILKALYYRILRTAFFVDPVRVFATSILVIVIFSGFYWLFNAITAGLPHRITFWEALYFSIVTFTTLGYGDYHPKPYASLQFLASIEAILGMVLLSLFVVTLYRRIVR